MAKIKQQTWSADLWGIVNSHSDPWTYRVFGSQHMAQEHLNAARATRRGLSRHRVKPISVTIRVIGGRPVKVKQD